MLASKLKVVRSSVTRSVNKLESECEQENIENVKKVLKEVCSNRDRLEELHSEKESELTKLLENNPGSEEIENSVNQELEKIEEYINRIQSAVATAETLIERELERTPLERDKDSACIRLPKITLPKFSGNVLEYVEFHEGFETAINKSNLSGVEKFAYLKGQLSGEALSTIAGLSLTNGNYTVAMELLNERYGDKNTLIRAHVRELLSLESVPNNQSVKFRAFLDKIQVQTRSLETLGVVKDAYGIFLTEIILSRIPYQLKLTFAKRDASDQTLDALISLLRTELKGIDSVKLINTERDNVLHHQTRKQSVVPPKSQRHYEQHPISFVTNSSNNSPKCLICKLNTHRTQDCSKLIDITDIDERVELVKKKNICFNCLGPHHIKNCQSSHKCSVCGKSHHSILHKEIKRQATEKFEKITSNVSAQPSCSSSIVPVLCLQLKSDSNKRVTTGALIDSGSHRSFISKELSKGLQHRVISSKFYSITGFSGNKFEGHLEEVECFFMDKMAHSYEKIKFICLPSLKQHIPSNEFSFDTADAHVTVNPPEKIEVIIGCDNYNKIVCGETVKLADNLFALNTRSGWAALGALETSSSYISSCIAVDTLSIFPDVALEQYWKTETMEYDDVAINNDLLKDPVPMPNGRYQVSFPWKPGKIMWSSYENEALNRLKFVLKRLKSEKLLSEYDEIIKNYVKNDIAEKVPKQETGGQIRYLPHHPVVRRDKSSTKVRSVLDASAKRGSNDLSLNDCLYEGDNYLKNLMGVLLRFRVNLYAMTGDIEKAFLQLELDPKDRDSVRFFWFEEKLTQDLPTSNPVAYRMKRLPFGIKSSPYLLCSTLNQHIKLFSDKYPKTTECLSQNLYMDDFVFTASTPQKAEEIRNQSVDILREMKMNLTKWNSSKSKVLGVQWDTKTDEIIVSFKDPSVISTKRELASLICSIWDPFGIISPFLIVLKLQLQECWKNKFDWDEKLPIKTTEMINSHLVDVEPVSIRRCILPHSNVEFHCFADASSKAYGACVYAKEFDTFGQPIHCNLYVAKSRLAPIKGTTIPRLELLAALLAAKLISLVQSEVWEVKQLLFTVTLK